MLNEDVVKNINKLNNERDNINLELSKKANKEHKHNVSDIEGLTIVANAEDINYTNIKNEEISNSKQALDVLFTDTETSKKSILDIENLVEAENIKYTTDTGECTIENSKKGYITNLNIQGKTLVNLWGNNISDFSLWKTTFSDNKINATTENGIMYYNFFTTNYSMYKPNTLYTVIVNIYKNTLPETSGIYVHSIGEEKSIFGNPTTDCTINGGKIGRFKYSFTTLNDLSSCNIALRSIINNDTSIAGHEVSLNMTILEGDYTNTNIEYFKGLQSVGQNKNIELLTFENDEVNLFNKNGNFKDNYILQYSNGEELVSETNNHKYTLDYIDVESNIEYTFYSCSRNICWYDENKTFIPTPLNERIIGDKDIFYVARSPKNAKYLRVTIIKDLHNDGNKTIITKRNKHDKKTIPYTLRSLPNGIKDEIVYKNNKYYLIKRCEEYTYTDIGNLNLSHIYNNTLQFMGTLVPQAIIDSLDVPYALCNRLNGKSRNDFNSNDEEGCSTTGSGDIAFKILKSKLSTQDNNGFNKWIKSNPITIIYQLAEPKEIELTLLNLEQYDNQTRFICNSMIVPSISFESTQNLGSHIEVIRETLKEVFQSGVNAKNNVVTTLASKGADVTTSDTWEDIKNKIDKKEGRLDLRETTLSNSYAYLVTNGAIKYIERCSGNFKTFDYEEPYFYVIKETHLIKINAMDETVVFDITLANANFSCICITQEFLFISDNNKLYKINKVTGSEIQSIEGAYYKLCAYGDYIYGVYGNETSSILHKIRISDMHIMLTKNLSSNEIYNFNRGKFVCNKNGIYATTEHSNTSSITDCHLSKINFDFTISKDFRIGGYLHMKNIKFLNDFVIVSDAERGIEIDSSKKGALVKYDANLNLIVYSDDSKYENFDIYNGYIYALYSLSSSPFVKINLSTLKHVDSYRKLTETYPNAGMFIINDIVFFINGGIFRNVLSKKVYSYEKGESL
ncbi:TPA: hypothetical protein ACVT6Z_001553 [Clostridioides difficile]|uniref:hypothetical protein n=1 Tax=Clostridioides difficile TaxID=1496 RepID=UPI0020C21A78|nr:hypothetical protein [Clostridioides difficile]MCP8386840.1 hypothetical protein [Clostridioides difficile]